jgi:hypothetical protein
VDKPDFPAEALARARRRAEYVMRELTAGDAGTAAGLILGFASFPAEVDDPSLSVLHNEPLRSRAGQGRRADSLNEDHLRAAENDRLGKLIVRESDGRAYDHENEVAASKQGLEHNLKKLQDKLRHEQEYRQLPPDDPAAVRAQRTIKEMISSVALARGCQD